MAELAKANNIPPRVILSQTFEDTREDPRRCAGRKFTHGTMGQWPRKIYESEHILPAPYFSRDRVSRDSYNYDFLVTNYISEKDGKKYIVSHEPNTNFPSVFGWNSWNAKMGESGIPIPGSYGCPISCGNQPLERFVPPWFTPNCAP